MFNYKPECLYDFMSLGIKEERDETLKELCENCILQRIENKESNNYDLLPKIVYNFLLKNTKFLKREEVVKKILESLGEEKRHKFLHVHYKGKK